MIKINKKNSGSALIIAILIIVFITSLMIYFLEKIVPIAANIKGIENGTVAYYVAQTGIEQTLFEMSSNNPQFETGSTFDETKTTGYSIQMYASGTTSPLVGEGNSEYNPSRSWYRISQGNPLQIAFKNLMTLKDSPSAGEDAIWIGIRVPNLDGNPGTATDIADPGSGKPLLIWQMSGNGYTLNSSSGVLAADINNAALRLNALGAIDEDNDTFGTRIKLHKGAGGAYAGTGVDLEGITGSFADFYSSTGPFVGKGLSTVAGDGAGCTGYRCSFKLSVAAPLKKTDGESIPYLEVRFSNSGPVKMPYQYAVIHADGYSFGFKRHIRRDVKQSTTNESLDFTVFQ